MVAVTDVQPSRRHRSLAVNSAGLVAGKAVQMGTGYVFWLLAARSADVHEVGVAAAAVSAVMLCTQLGLLGCGAAAIVLLGRRTHPPHLVVGAALGVLATAAAIAAVVAVAVLGVVGGDLGSEVRQPAFAAIVVVAALAGTVIICFDQVSIALGLGHDTLARYAVSGSAAVAALALAGSGRAEPAALVLLACWTLDATVASAIGWVQARRQLGRWIMPTWRSGGDLLRLGLPNHALTLAERAPALLVPVLTAQVASASVAGAWYPAWMMAWVAYTAPVAVGLAQFSEIVRRPDQLRRTTAHALRWSLALGGAIAAVLVLGARPLLSLLGPEYAESSTTALRILALGLVPYAVIQAYNAACRSTSRLREATAAGVVTGAAACAGAAVAATHGTTAMAVAWVGAFTVGAGWAGARLLSITGGVAPTFAGAVAGARP